VRRAAVLAAVLTLLVWGLLACDHGLFHDDASSLAFAQRGASRPLGALFVPEGAPTRLLQTLPYDLAWASGRPTRFLQVWYGAVWAGTALLVFALARRLAPGAGALPLVACGLAATATSDFLTNTTEAVSYLDAALLLLAALVAALRFTQGGRAAWMAAAALLLNASLFTLEGLAPAALLAPLFFFSADGAPHRRRLAALVWLLALVPFGIVLAAYVRDPSSYATVALKPLSVAERLRGIAGQTATDFLPWQWVFSRPTWFETLPRLLPASLLAGTAAAGVAALFILVGISPGRIRESDERRLVRAGATCLLVVLAQHAAYAGAQLADRRFRTQLVSRVFASLLVAIAASLLARRLRRPAAALALPAAFVGFGIAGGLERHDFFLSRWRRERVELASLLAEVPALDARAMLILSLEPDPGGWQATRAPYLAEAWVSLLLDDAGAGSRTRVCLTGWGATCREEAAGLRCGTETLPWNRLVLLRFDAPLERYRLVPEIAASNGTYRPRDLIRRSPPSRRALSLVAPAAGLARLLPGGANAMLAAP
jgi:hypothetical protein